MIVHELASGFLIEHDGRSLAAVDTARSCIEITVRRGGHRAFATSRAGLRAAIDLLARYVRPLERVRPAAAAGPRQADMFAASPSAIAPHLDDRAIERLLFAALRRVAIQKDSEIDAVIQAVARERSTPLVLSPAVVGQPFLARDVLRFRPAAIAIAFVETISALTERAEYADDARGLLADWRVLFARDGESTRALNKTLADLPPDALAPDVWALRHVRLELPVQSALHLRLVAQRARGAEAARDEHLSLVQHAGMEELLQSRERVAMSLGLAGAPDVEKDHLFAEALAASGARRGQESLRSMLRRSVVDRRSGRVGLDPATRTVPPPIPPPRGARLLATVGEIVLEGERMHHCVGAHARRAVEGGAFIFHVQFGGEHATVEVSVHGDVVDSAGPCNESNRAARHARRLLTAWGKGLTAGPLSDGHVDR